jgi:TonB-linked SusC/RagA family outer membrane protein
MERNPKNYLSLSIKSIWSKIQLIIFLISFIFFGLSTVNAADNNLSKAKINLRLENASIKSILNAIEKQTDYIFIYNGDVVNSNLKRTISVKDASLDNVMEIIFSKLDVVYKIDGRQVYILKKTKVTNEKPKSDKTTNKITGIITDENNQSVIGANIIVAGTTTGTLTDINGAFAIEAPQDAQLKISYIGYETKFVNVNGRSVLNVSITPAIKALDEVVVVGYGIQKKSDVTGAIGQVKASEIKNTVTTDIASTLQGKISGVYIMNNSGQAGAGVDIQIRGITSLNNVSALWIIDGVPGDANTVNVNDIETIDVIKDGTAAAIYGVKAAAGVILVTTKRGIGQRKPKISFNTYTGLSNAWRLPEMLNSDQYITLKNEQWAETATGIPVGLSMDSIGKYPTTNWMKEMFRQGKVQNYDLNVSGSTETTNYYIGGTYFKNEPSFVDNSIERYSFRINSDYKIAKWIKLGESLSFLHSKTNPVGAEGVYLSSIFRTPPMMPVYDSNNQPGGYGYVKFRDIGDYDGENPMAMQLTDKSMRYHNQISGNAYATVSIVPGLTVTGTMSGNISFDNNKTVKLPYKLSELKNHSTTDISLEFSTGWNVLFNVYANYIKDFGKHNINVTAGYEAAQYAGSNLSGSGVNAKFGLEVLNQTDVTGRTTAGSESLGRSISQLGRLIYKYADKYIVEGIVRRDGSDKFGPMNRYGVFPSLSFAWKLSEEDFIKNIPVISFLKLRGGYGVNGNDNIGQFKYESYMSNSQFYPFGTYGQVVNYSGMIASSSLANPYIEWERSRMLDGGIELGLFKNALFINIEPYIKSSDHMLFYQPLALSSGLADQYNYDPNQVINAGFISNRGVDFSVTYQARIGKLHYSVGANLSTFKYTVDELADDNPILASSVLAAGVQVSKTTVGQSSGYFFGYQCDGIFQSQEQVDEYNNNARDIAKEKNPNITAAQLANIYYNSENTAPGDLIFRDLNNDGVITTDDREKIGTPWPAATYGLQLMADYKGVDLRISSAGVYKRDVFNASKVDMYQFSNYDYSTTTKALSRWTPENHSTTNYRINGNDPNKNMSNPSSWYIEDGSFFRIKNVELGYTIPVLLTSKVGISRCRLYVSGQNLFTFTKYTGFDPEFGIGNAISSGVDGGSYPQSKIYTMGLQVEF